MDEIQLLMSGSLIPFILDAWRRLIRLEGTIDSCSYCKKKK